MLFVMFDLERFRLLEDGLCLIGLDGFIRILEVTLSVNLHPGLLLFLGAL